MKTDKYSCSLGAYTLMGDIQSTDINVTTWAIRKTTPPPQSSAPWISHLLSPATFLPSAAQQIRRTGPRAAEGNKYGGITLGNQK